MTTRSGWYMTGSSGPVAIGGRVTVAGRLSAWRWRRSNRRRRDEQRASVAEIVRWLPGVLGGDGAVGAVEHVVEHDGVDVDIVWRGVLRRLSFGLLAAWAQIERREAVATAIRDALDEDAAELVDVPLSAIAEEEWLDREWRSPRS